MNRRDLIKYLLATPIASQLDVEKLLWIPGEKVIFTFNSKVDWDLGIKDYQVEMFFNLDKLYGIKWLENNDFQKPYIWY